MAQSMPFIILVTALLNNTFSYCSAENVYCVTPTTTSCSSCPYNSTNCTTFSEYAQEAQLYFTSNTTLVFLPGDHTLDTNITVANITRLTIQGESSSGHVATIVCNGSVGFSFTSMVDFRIHSLAFALCSRKDNTLLTSFHALLIQSTQNAELVNCSFHDNLGTALVVNNTSITLAGNSEFTHNHCEFDSCVYGGGIAAFSSHLTFIENTTFQENNVTSDGKGSAIYASKNTLLNFNGTSTFINNLAGNGGAIYAIDNVVLSFNGTTSFINNSAVNNRGAGGAMYASINTVISFTGTNNFINNSALYVAGGALYASSNTVFSFNGTTSFINNSAENGGAICAYINTTLIFSKTINFASNGLKNRRIVHASSGVAAGGGVYMELKSTFSVLPNTTVYWENNHASLGGAIYVLDASPLSYCASVATVVPKEECFFQFPGQNLSNGIDVQLVFKNNFADQAGSVIYGGVIDNCKLTGLDSYSSGEVFDMIAHIEDDNPTSSISSDTFLMCVCQNNLPYCNPKLVAGVNRYPGETFLIPVVAVGQRNGIFFSMVRSYIPVKEQNYSHLLPYQYLQQTKNTCTEFYYTVFSLSEKVDIYLHSEYSPCSKFNFDYDLQIVVILNQTCPPGFQFSESARACVCEPRLAKYTGTHQCNITNAIRQITRDSGQQFWVGYDNQSHGLIIHPHCPFDYCVSDTVRVDFPVINTTEKNVNTDIQCAHNRSGLLCGACKKGYSLALGTSQCKQCTNSHLAFLIPFAVMGVALVFFLLLCRLTVATGMLSGLVFYANIVRVNHTIFIPGESSNPISVFIAWLNLDFGIETCFYNGMDEYIKTWLQFVFPVYIWVIIGLMILVSHYSRRFARLLGNSPVSVLATLILLSYTKILRTLITVLYVTYLEYPTYNSMVWLYDANIHYLSGNHVPLFIVAVLVFLFLFLPYTLLLLFGQWLQAISYLRLFSWVNSARLKPFMDSYHGPYKAKHRYWPGLLLMLRFVLFLVFAFEFNPQQDRTSINLLAILVGAGIVVVWAWVSGGIYRNWCLDALEGSFVLNLITLAASTMYTYHVSQSERDQLVVGYISVTIAFATFIGILVFQMANLTGIAHYLKMKCAAIRKVHQAEGDVEPEDIASLPDRLLNPGEYEPQFYNPQRHTEPMEEEEMVNEAQRMLIPAYTYGSIS